MNQEFSEMTGKTKPEAESTESLFPNPKEKRDKPPPTENLVYWENNGKKNEKIIKNEQTKKTTKQKNTKKQLGKQIVTFQSLGKESTVAHNHKVVISFHQKAKEHIHTVRVMPRRGITQPGVGLAAAWSNSIKRFASALLTILS